MIIELLVAILLFAGVPAGIYIFARKKVTWEGIEDMFDRYRYHFFFLILISIMKSLFGFLEAPVEKLYAINFTPMVYEFEGNRIFWVQHTLHHPAMTFAMAVVYIGSFLFIMVFSVAFFAYLDYRKVASKLIYLNLVLFTLCIPFYLLVEVYVPSYPKMFYPEANSIISGMQPLLYNYGPNVNQFFLNYDTFNNCFPSMHIGYPAAILMTVLMEVKGFRGFKIALATGLGLIAVAIIYLGIHWLSDIVGGLLIATLGVAIMQKYAFRFWRHVKNLDTRLKSLKKRLVRSKDDA